MLNTVGMLILFVALLPFQKKNGTVQNLIKNYFSLYATCPYKGSHPSRQLLLES